MTTPPGRRNAELEAWDRELRGTAGDEGEEAPPPAGAGPAAANGTLAAGDPGAGVDPGDAGDPIPAGRTDDGSGAAGGEAAEGARGRPVEPSGAAEGVPADRARRPAADEEEPEGATPAPWNAQDEGVTTEVLLRDLIIFQVKLLLDGLKDVVLSPLAIAAVLWDLVPSRNAPRGRAFYQVLKVGERFDLWLNLYNPSSAERQDHEGLLEAGVHSADSLMGKLEQLARAEAEKQKGWQGIVSPPLRGQGPKGRRDPEA